MRVEERRGNRTEVEADTCAPRAVGHTEMNASSPIEASRPRQGRKVVAPRRTLCPQGTRGVNFCERNPKIHGARLQAIDTIAVWADSRDAL